MSADTSAAEFCERNITDLSVTEFSFGGYLRALRTAKGCLLYTSLYLVRTILQMHGGDICVHSTVGEYCQFEFHLPIEPAIAAEQV